MKYIPIAMDALGVLCQRGDQYSAILSVGRNYPLLTAVLQGYSSHTVVFQSVLNLLSVACPRAVTIGAVSVGDRQSSALDDALSAASANALTWLVGDKLRVAQAQLVGGCTYLAFSSMQWALNLKQWEVVTCGRVRGVVRWLPATLSRPASKQH